MTVRNSTGGSLLTVLPLPGPNMAGKSTFIRSVGIACLLAQIGSFVPAEEAVMTVIDRICARYFVAHLTNFPMQLLVQ